MMVRACKWVKKVNEGMKVEFRAWEWVNLVNVGSKAKERA